MAKKFAGVKSVSYSPTGANTWTEIGEPLTDGEMKNEAAKVETASGAQLYAGTNNEGNFAFTDEAQYSALATIMQNDTKVDLKVTFLDDSSEVIAISTNIIVSKTRKMKVGDLNGFKLEYKSYSI